MNKMCLFVCLSIHHVSLARNEDLAKVLLENGADVNIRNDEGLLAVTWAKINGMFSSFSFVCL